MITVTGRLVARVVMYIAGVAFLVLSGFSYHADRITVRDVILGGIALVFGAIAALWLWGHPAHGGQS